MNYLRTERTILLLLGAVTISTLLLWASYLLLFPQTTPSEDSTTPSSSTLATATSTATSTTPNITPTPGAKEVRFIAPYPLTWKDGGVTFTLTSATLDSSRFVLRLKVAMPDAALCAPLNIERLVDEAGNFVRSETSQFTFPNSGGCIGAPNAIYENQEVVFRVKSGDLPYTFTTGGSANIFFVASVSDAGELNVAQPSTAG